MVGWGVVLWGVMAAVMVSSTPIEHTENDLNHVPELAQAMEQIIMSNLGVKQHLQTVMEGVVTTPEDLQRFNSGFMPSDGGKNVAEYDAHVPVRNSSTSFFARSLVAAMNSGNNPQLEAILAEMKDLNSNFKKYLHSAVCPEPFIHLGDECLNFHLEDLSWEDSRQHCLELGGDLAIPANLTHVRLYIGENFPRKNTRNFWLGGKENNKVWEWLTGEHVNPELWYINEPSGNGVCLAMFDGWERPLSDFPCQNQRRSICEHPIQS